MINAVHQNKNQLQFSSSVKDDRSNVRGLGNATEFKDGNSNNIGAGL
jgi:hypothetical protein